MKPSIKYKHSPDEIASIVSKFFSVRGLVRARLARGAKFTTSEWLRIETLRFIGSRKNPRVKDIAEYLSVTAPSTTSLVSGLVQKGLVVRSIDSSDRRTARIELSTKGQRMLLATMKRGNAVLSEFFEPLSKDELKKLASYLERVIEVAQEK